MSDRQRVRRLQTPKPDVIPLVRPEWLSPEFTFSRASAGSNFNSAGSLESKAANIPRFSYDAAITTLRGLALEGARTNSLRNSTMVGAVAGTPGTNPTNWTYTSGSALVKEIVAVGSANGMDYIDIRISGTPSATSGHVMSMETTTQIAALQGQSWTGSLYASLIAGSVTNVGAVRINIIEMDAGGATLQTTFGSSFRDSLTSTLQRFAAVRTLTDASTAFVRMRWEFGYTISLPVDFTIRLAAPQLEQGLNRSSFIPTSTVAVTRAAEVCHITDLDKKPWFNPDGGAFSIQATSTATSQNTLRATVVSLNDGTTNNSVDVARDNNLGRAYKTVGGSDNCNINSGAWAGLSEVKMGFGFGNNIGNGAVGGVSGTPDLVGAMPTGLNRLSLGSAGDDTRNFFGYLKSAEYIPEIINAERARSLSE